VGNRRRCVSSVSRVVAADRYDSERGSDSVTDSVVEARGLKRDYSFGKEIVHALCGVSFDVPAGDYVAIVGPSGCGKSTLLNLLGAVDRPTSGSVTIGGTAVSALPDNAATRFRLTN